MTIFDQSKSLVENLNYLSGPIIALLGLVAILQLRLSKKTMVITSKRQSAEKATQQIRLYSEEMIPLIDELDKLHKQKSQKSIVVENIVNFTY